MKFSQFLHTYGLDLRLHIRQRSYENNLSRFYVNFDKHVSICEGNFERGWFGDGKTPLEAAKEFCKVLSNRKCRLGDDHGCTIYQGTIPKLVFDLKDKDL